MRDVPPLLSSEGELMVCSLMICHSSETPEGVKQVILLFFVLKQNISPQLLKEMFSLVYSSREAYPFYGRERVVARAGTKLVILHR